jgi:hypothetical protein
LTVISGHATPSPLVAHYRLERLRDARRTSESDGPKARTRSQRWLSVCTMKLSIGLILIALSFCAHAAAEPLVTVWIMRGVVCGPPDPTRNVCHGTQVVGTYASEAQCNADIPAMRGRRFDDFSVPEVDDACEQSQDLTKEQAERSIRITKEDNLKADLSDRRGPASSWGLYIVTNGFMHQKDDASYATREECERVGYDLASRGKIRSYLCSVAAETTDDSRPAGIVYMWRMDATWCGPYPVDPTQTVCKEQSLGSYGSEALCTADISEMQKEGYTDLSCERIAIQEPCSDVVCGP